MIDCLWAVWAPIVLPLDERSHLIWEEELAAFKQAYAITSCPLFERESHFVYQLWLVQYFAGDGHFDRRQVLLGFDGNRI